MKKIKTWIPWAIGLGLATATLLVLALWTNPHYLGSDDAPILRAFMGYEGGVPAHVHLCTHTVLAWLLYGLAVVFPGVAWFSILQIFFLWFSGAVLIKAMCQCALRQGRPLWLGASSGLLFVWVFVSYVGSRISFTTTAAVLGAAAVAQLMAVDFEKGTHGQIVKGMLLSIGLLMACYCLRQISLLPPLAFWLLALFMLVWRLMRTDKQHWKRLFRPVCTGFLVGLVGFGLLIGMRALEIKLEGLDSYLAWHNARSRLFDYANFIANTDLTRLPEIGWNRGLFYLFGQWFFLDSAITAQAMDTLYAMQPPLALGIGQQLLQALAALWLFFVENPSYGFAMAVLLVLCATSIVCACKQKNRPIAWGALGGLLLGFFLLLYLGVGGRLPLRAVLSPLLPMGSFLFQVMLLAIPDGLWGDRGTKKIWACIVTALCLLLCWGSLSFTTESLRPLSDEETQGRIDSIPADADAFALENPDVLIIFDITMVLDSRLFPDTSLGIPGNLMFWGGWQAKSPSWRYQLQQYGLDPDNLTARDLLGENIVFATAVGNPHSALFAYMGESTQTELDWDYYAMDGYMTYFQFVAYETDGDE